MFVKRMLIFLAAAVAVALMMWTDAEAAPTVATPGVPISEETLVLVTVCGMAVSVTEATAEGKTVVWIGPNAVTRMAALNADPTRPVYNLVEVGEQNIYLAPHCDGIRKAREARAQQQPA